MDDLQKYTFAPRMEPLAIQTLCSLTGDNLIHMVDVDGFDDPCVQWIIKAIKACYQEHKICPRDLSTLCQQLALIHKDGKINKQEYNNILTAACGIFACPMIDKELVIKQLTKQIQTVARYKALGEGIQEMTEASSTETLQARLASIESLEVADAKPPVTCIDSCEVLFNEMDLIITGEFPTGVVEIDSTLGNGLSAGEVVVICAPTSAGKSRAVTGLENVHLGCGRNVYHMDNENGIKKKGSMHIACALGVPFRAVYLNPQKRRDYRRLYARYMEEDQRGLWEYKWYDSSSITIEGVWENMLRRQDELKIEFHAVSLDFLAKLKFTKYEGKYDGIGAAADYITAKANDEKKVVYSPHQAKQRRDIEEVPLGINDSKDSSNFPAAVDHWWTLNPFYAKDGTQSERHKIKINMAKVRTAEGIDPFVIEHAFRYSALHANQVGWRPKASLPSYNPMTVDIDAL